MSVIIDYNHEDGTLNEWEGNTDATEVTAASAAALAGTSYGMQVVIDDTTGAYVYRSGINNTSGKMRARFYIDPNSLTMASNDSFVLFYARDSTPDTFCIVGLRYNTTDGYCLYGRIINDAGTGTSTPLDGNKITDGPHYVEVYVQRASSADANDGRLDFWVDGTGQQSITGVDCYNRFGNTNLIGMGAISGILTGTTGTFYLDELVVNDDGGVIGPYASALTAVGITTGAPTLGAPTLEVPAGNTDDLTAADITTAAPSLGAPTLGIVYVIDDIILEWEDSVYALTAAGITTSAPTLDAPTIGQIHALSANGITTGNPDIGAPSMAGEAALIADGITTGQPTLGQPSIGQAHVLIAEWITTSTPILGAPSIGQIHNLSAAGITNGAPILGAPESIEPITDWVSLTLYTRTDDLTLYTRTANLTVETRE